MGSSRRGGVELEKERRGEHATTSTFPRHVLSPAGSRPLPVGTDLTLPFSLRPTHRKWLITTIAVVFTFLATFNLSSFAIGMSSMEADLNLSALDGSLGIAVYAWAFGFAPLLLAPLSEEVSSSSNAKETTTNLLSRCCCASLDGALCTGYRASSSLVSDQMRREPRAESDG
jgi:hypothetical protein